MADLLSDQQEIIERSENVREELGARLTFIVIPAFILLVLGFLMVFVYPGAILIGLGWVFFLLGLAGVGYGIYLFTRTKKITEYSLDCPFCFAKNTFTAKPNSDVRCNDCARMVPILNGVVLQVFQVRCGYCQHLNYYSEKSTGLICENCDSVIPIATDEEPEALQVLEQYTRREESSVYDLVLTSEGNKTEKLISCLQQMLALNRNQIKLILDQTPATLFTGIPKKKAQLLQREIEAAGGQAEYSVSEEPS
jgi:ribosomal protein S27E